MDQKDVFTIAVSTPALITSATSLISTIRPRSIEMKRSLNTQLTTVVTELSQAVRGAEEPSRMPRILSLARQAIYLNEQKLKEATNIECATIAEAMALINDEETSDIS